MFALDFKAAKEGFFDRQLVLDAVDKPTREILNEFGRLVRKDAQKSLVYDDGPSPAGQPPHAHRSRTRTRISKKTGKERTRSVSFLREFLFYSFDKERRSVVIGPVKLSSTVDSGALPALEYGGKSTIVDHGKEKRVSIAARPFMRPAFQAELPGLPAMWKNSIK